MWWKIALIVYAAGVFTNIGGMVTATLYRKNQDGETYGKLYYGMMVVISLLSWILIPVIIFLTIKQKKEDGQGE